MLLVLFNCNVGYSSVVYLTVGQYNFSLLDSILFHCWTVGQYNVSQLATWAVYYLTIGQCVDNSSVKSISGSECVDDSFWRKSI